MNDCIQGVTVYDKENKKLGDLTFIKEPTFDPFEVRQKWDSQATPDTKEMIEGYATFDANGFGSGLWKLPDGLKLSDGKDLVGISVARMLGAVQVNISPEGLREGVSLPVGYFFETTLKSKGLKKYTRWVTSNGKDPHVSPFLIQNKDVMISTAETKRKRAPTLHSSRSTPQPSSLLRTQPTKLPK